MNTLFHKLNPYFNLAARILMSLIFVVSGFGKINEYAGTQGFMQSLGIPGALLPLVIVVEFGGGLALLLGLQTRLAAFLLAGFALLAGSIVHFHPNDQESMIVFMDNLAIIGGLLLFAQYGGGAFSLDKLRK
ncbi:DoxX family protein [Solimicrobium silvestre]|uniref:Putative membrane protein n=1 Tax=Solimicrobium silvestre TaxID=2099400 RepID=A0A2S9H4F6_9BURK|nr:DoxX family protein [Solimicrobium silvestre]PRC94848.1 putative membrane protein [Solimicrobium silvestre]